MPKSAEAISSHKPATNVANGKVAMVTERPAEGNEKVTIHSAKVGTHASNHATYWIS